MKLYICLFQVCAFVHKYQVHLFEIHFNGGERVEEVRREGNKGSQKDQQMICSAGANLFRNISPIYFTQEFPPSFGKISNTYKTCEVKVTILICHPNLNTNSLLKKTKQNKSSLA